MFLQGFGSGRVSRWKITERRQSANPKFRV